MIKTNNKNQNEIIEKFSLLIALEASKERFEGKSLLEARINFLSRPYTGRNFQLKNVEDYTKDLIKFHKEGRSNIPEITQQGREELYNPQNRDIVIKILGSTMKDLGDQFVGYGSFMQELTDEKQSSITLQQFQNMLEQSYRDLKSEETRLHGVIPLDLIKEKISQKINISDQLINEYLLKLEQQRIIDLEIAYDASSVKRPEYGIDIPGRGLVYFLTFRN